MPRSLSFGDSSARMLVDTMIRIRIKLSKAAVWTLYRERCAKQKCKNVWNPSRQNSAMIVSCLFLTYHVGKVQTQSIVFINATKTFPLQGSSDRFSFLLMMLFFAPDLFLSDGITQSRIEFCQLFEGSSATLTWFAAYLRSIARWWWIRITLTVAVRRVTFQIIRIEGPYI